MPSSPRRSARPPRRPDGCPHCDSRRVGAMKPRPNEKESSVRWFQCRTCERMWSVPKRPMLGRKKR